MIHILPSKRTGIYYLEYCRVSQADERIVYNKSDKGYEKFFSIPEQNTSVILLGSGTSITQAAARQLGDAGVMIAFVGGGGTPLFMGSFSEYRPNEYFFKYLEKWQNEEKKLIIAKNFQKRRIEFVNEVWHKNKSLKDISGALEKANSEYYKKIEKTENTFELLGYEANYAKNLYKISLEALGYKGNFLREPGKKDDKDVFNSYLDNGNYLAYGISSVALWTLGLPFQMAVIHGKTRRGAFVFDVADIVKDAVIMPSALEAAINGDLRSSMRKKCIRSIIDNKALDYIFETLKTEVNR